MTCCGRILAKADSRLELLTLSTITSRLKGMRNFQRKELIHFVQKTSW